MSLPRPSPLADPGAVPIPAPHEPDPLWTLVRKGTLTGELAGHGFALRRAYELLAAPAGAPTMRARSGEGGSRFDSGSGRSGTPLRASERAVVLQESFNAWVEAMDAQHMPTGPVLDVIVEGFSCRAIERRCRKRNGWMGRLLAEALTLYGACRTPNTARPHSAPEHGTTRVIRGRTR